MAQVIYNGNGSDDGQVPVDFNSYSAGATVNVAINDSTTALQQQDDSNGNPENIVTGCYRGEGVVSHGAPRRLTQNGLRPGRISATRTPALIH